VGLRTDCLPPFARIFCTMSLAKVALHARPRPANATLFLQRRPASSAVAQEHHNEHHDSDGMEYPNEGAWLRILSASLDSYLAFLAGFLTPFWRNTVLCSMLIAGFYKFAPARGEEIYLTRYLAQFKPTQEAWASLNEKNVMDVATRGEGQLLQASAQRPAAHRYRYPQYAYCSLFC
jgi:hypothetical protein